MYLYQPKSATEASTNNKSQSSTTLATTFAATTKRRRTSVATRSCRPCRLKLDAFLWMTLGAGLHMAFTTLLITHVRNPFLIAIQQQQNNSLSLSSSLSNQQDQRDHFKIQQQNLQQQQQDEQLQQQQQISSNTNTTTPRYYQLPWSYNRPKHIPPVTTAFRNSTMVVRAPWFPSTKHCKKTCCVEHVAISLQQDDTRIKNIMDGRDLADILITKVNTLPEYVIPSDFHATYFSLDIIPCLQPGTILLVENSPLDRLKSWFTEYRPMIQNISHILITSETDRNSPHPFYSNRLSRKNVDRMILKWYGTHPDTRTVEYKDTFIPFPLGLSDRSDSMYYMTEYLQQINFTNPFAGIINKKRWIESVELQTAIETTNILFAHFHIHKKGDIQHFKIPYDVACNHIVLHQNTVQPIHPISCTTANYSIPELYTAASQYLFGMSPVGMNNGWDSFRTYELWLLGVIPIVEKKSSAMTDMYQGLPMIEVNHWAGHTQESLLQLMRDYIKSDEFQKNDFTGWERLFLRYWRRKILKDAGRDKDIIKDDQGREYYQGWKYSLYESSNVHG